MALNKKRNRETILKIPQCLLNIYSYASIATAALCLCVGVGIYLFQGGCGL